jgi:hypothetical protein
MGQTNSADPRDVATETALLDRQRFGQYQKKVPTLALQMAVPFRVETTEGTMEGHAGDYLCLDAKGNPYPCAKDVFETSYERV